MERDTGTRTWTYRSRYGRRQGQPLQSLTTQVVLDAEPNYDLNLVSQNWYLYRTA